MFQLSYFYPSESLSPLLGSHTGVTLYLSQVETTAQHHMPSRAALTPRPLHDLSLSLYKAWPSLLWPGLVSESPQNFACACVEGGVTFFLPGRKQYVGRVLAAGCCFRVAPKSL